MGIAKRFNLTIRQKKFVNALIEDPTNASKAALKAGYSPNSVRQIASQLLKNERVQGIIEQYFVDEQEYVVRILRKTLKHIDTVLDDEDEQPKEKTKAAKIGLEYTRLAAGILGIDVKKRPKPFEDVETITAEELKRNLEIELAAVNKLLKDQPLNGSTPESTNATPDAGAGEVPDKLPDVPEGGSELH